MCKCQECGANYKTDFIISDALWERIKPEGSPEGAGMLCPGCIGGNIEALDGYKAFNLTEIT